MTHATTIIKCAIAAFAIASCAQAGQGDARQLELENKRLEDEVVKLRGHIDELRKEIVALNDERIASHDECEALREEMEKLVKENQRLTEALKAAMVNKKAKSGANDTKNAAKGKSARSKAMGKTEDRMKDMRLPSVRFKPPATLEDALYFFRRASIEFDDPDVPEERRGFNIVLLSATEDGNNPVIPTISATAISFWDALELVLSSVSYEFTVDESVIKVMPKGVKPRGYSPLSYAKGSPKESKSEKQARLEAYEIEKRMKKIVLPSISFKSPATLVDAVQFFIGASKDFDDPKLPKDKRGFNIAMRLDEDDMPAAMPFVATSEISYWNALALVCQAVGYKFEIKGSNILVLPSSMTTQQLVTRNYKVSESVLDKAIGTGKVDSLEEKTEKWLAWLQEKGIDWPIDMSSENSTLFYYRATNSLRITNTPGNLDAIERILKIKPAK